MTALAHERPETMSDAQADSLNMSDPDEGLWQVWKAMELPEGYRAEIIEGAIEVSPTGRRSHGLIANRVRRALDKFLDGSEYACHQDVNLIHKRRVWIPDAFVAPEDTEPCGDEEDMGVRADSVHIVIEVVSPARATRTETASASAVSTPAPASPCTSSSTTTTARAP